MGSFISQAWAIEHGSAIDALLLSGSNYGSTVEYHAGRQVARFEKWRLGARGKSALLEFLSFGAFNKAFRPNRTAYDWLSRDPNEVDKETHNVDTLAKLVAARLPGQAHVFGPDELTDRSLRFLAQPNHSYQIYFNADRSVTIPTSEAGNLAGASDIRRIAAVPTKNNSAYIPADVDGDGIQDLRDNCVSIANPDQAHDKTSQHQSNCPAMRIPPLSMRRHSLR